LYRRVVDVMGDRGRGGCSQRLRRGAPTAMAAGVPALGEWMQEARFHQAVLV
jgi:hypothetical protein